MKRIVTLMLAAGLIFCANAPKAQAAETTVHGALNMVGDIYENIYYTESNTPWNVASRFDMRINMKMAEGLSATTLIRSQAASWGNPTTAYAMNDQGWNAGSAHFGLINAFLDWVIPTTSFTVRAGLQPGLTPSYTYSESLLFFHPEPGVKVSGSISDSTKLSIAWFRPLSYATTINGGEEKLSGSIIDAFTLQVPLDLGSFKVTPYAQFLIAGKDANYAAFTGGNKKLIASLFSGFQAPSGSVSNGGTGSTFKENTVAFWLGFTSKFDINDNASVSLDFLYGDQDSDPIDTTGGDSRYDRSGWLAGASAKYKMDFGQINFVGWYGSGDDDESENGSERLPTISSNFNPGKLIGGTYAGDILFSGGYSVETIYQNGIGTPAGTMGLGFGVSNMTFVTDLYHSLWTLYTVGTNHKDNVDTIGLAVGNYLTTKDDVLQFGLTNHYNIYKNLVARLEVVYALNGYDKNVWGDDKKYENPFKFAAGLVYNF